MNYQKQKNKITSTMNYIHNNLSKQENIVTNTKYLLIPSSLTGFNNTETTIRKSVSERDVYCHIGHLTIQEHERIFHVDVECILTVICLLYI